MRSKRVLAVSARNKSLSSVLFADGKLREWHRSTEGIRSIVNARIRMKRWINSYDPDIVILESCQSSRRKSLKQRRVIRELKRVARSYGKTVISIPRDQSKPMIEQAHRLAKKFPAMKYLTPKKPKLWEAEPETTAVFEALSLAVSAKSNQR